MSPKPTWQSLVTLGALGTLLAVAGALAQSPTPTFAPGTQARVTVSSAVLRSQPRSLSPSVKSLAGGDTVEIIEAQSPWYRARSQGTEGYIHGSALLDTKSYSVAVGSGATGVTYAERTAAARGFNPKVEEQHRKDEPNLDAGYTRVDQIEAKSTTLDAILSFRKQGGQN